jgi:hypothetical protein
MVTSLLYIGPLGSYPGGGRAEGTPRPLVECCPVLTADFLPLLLSSAGGTLRLHQLGLLSPRAEFRGDWVGRGVAVTGLRPYSTDFTLGGTGLGITGSTGFSKKSVDGRLYDIFWPLPDIVGDAGISETTDVLMDNEPGVVIEL